MRDEQSAGAGDHEHDDGSNRGLFPDAFLDAAGGEEPHQRGHHQDDPEVVGRQLFDEFLSLSLGRFRFANQFLDLADGRFTGDRGDDQFDLARQVRRTGVDFATGRDLDGDGFAGQGRLVDVAFTVGDPAIDGQIFSRTNTHGVPDGQFVQVDLAFVAVGIHQSCDIRGEVDQFANGALEPP